MSLGAAWPCLTLENNDIFSVLLYNHFLLPVVFSFGIWLAISNPFSFDNVVNIDVVNSTAGNMLIEENAAIRLWRCSRGG